MKQSLLLVGVILALSGRVGVAQEQPFPLAPVPEGAVGLFAGGPIPSRELCYLGVGSCATSGCHGRTEGLMGCEIGQWRRDPHANAWETLLGGQSQRMVARLGFAEPATHVGLCLDCHSIHAPPHRQGERFAVSEGVSCEACHGPAERWLAGHYRPEWKTFTPAQKEACGMRDTQTVSGRVSLCAECHVGTKDRHVNHDLIAAGHPPMRFEVSAWHDAMPRHWIPALDTEAEPSFSARMWLAGQAAMSRRQLELLSESPTATLDWAGFNCTACHQNVGTGTRAARSGLRATLVWGDWMAALSTGLERTTLAPTGLSNRLGQISREARPLGTMTNEMAHLRLAAAADLAAWEHDFLAADLSLEQVQSLLRLVAATADETAETDWYAAWQRYLALRAVYLSQKRLGAADESLEHLLNDLRPLLASPSRFGASDRESPARARAVFATIRDHVGR